MQKVRFLQDYRGELTLEFFYQCGEEVDFPADVAAALVENKRAEYVAEESTSAGDEPAPHTPRKKRGKE